MRSISALSTVIAAAALVLGLTACGTSDNDSAKTTTVAATTTRATTTQETNTLAPPPTTSPAPITTVTTAPAPPPGPTTVSCGSGAFGLDVFAITTNGAAACPIALEVTNAYALQAELWDPGFVVPVTVGASTWDCQEFIGTPNPYQECVSRDNPAEKARLSS